MSEQYREYRVIWEIDISADSPRRAAEDARAIMRNPDSIATFFTVIDEDGGSQSIDLKDEEGSN